MAGPFAAMSLARGLGFGFSIKMPPAGSLGSEDFRDPPDLPWIEKRSARILNFLESKIRKFKDLRYRAAYMLLAGVKQDSHQAACSESPVLPDRTNGKKRCFWLWCHPRHNNLAI